MVRRGLFAASLLALVSCDQQQAAPEPEQDSVKQEPLLNPGSSQTHQPSGTVQPLPQRPSSSDEMGTTTTQPE